MLAYINFPLFCGRDSAWNFKDEEEFSPISERKIAFYESSQASPTWPSD